MSKQLKTLSYAVRKPLSKVAVPFNIKPFGISFLVPLYNEEKTVRRSLLSILDIADQIIVLDTSTDNSFNEIVDLLTNEKIEYYRFEKQRDSFIRKLNFGLSKVKYCYVWKYAGDLILKPQTIIWKERLKLVREYVFVDCTHVNFENGKLISGDFLEPYIFTYHSSLRFCVKTTEQIRGLFSFGQRFPFFYKQVLFSEKYIIHYDLKDEWRKRNRRLIFGFN